MKLSRITALTTAAAAALTLAAMAATPTFAQMKDEKTVTVGGAPMYARLPPVRPSAVLHKNVPS